MAEQTAQLRFPEIVLWDKDKRTPKITFINPSDFRRESLLEVLGLATSPLAESFGVIDREEVMRRQRIAKFIFDNPAMASFFMGTEFPFSVPTEGQVFLDYYNPRKEHNPFWRVMGVFAEILPSCQNVPPELESLAEFLSQTRPEMEKAETEMAREIGERLQRATYFEGVASFKLSDSNGGLSLDRKKTVFYGFRRYSYTLSRILREVDSPFENCVLSKLAEICQAVISWINGRIFYAPLRIRQMPYPALNDICFFLKKQVGECLGEFYDYRRPVTLKVLFRYSDQGLQAQLVGIDREDESGRSEKKEAENRIGRGFSGYSTMDRFRISRTNRMVLNRISGSEEQLFLARVLAKIREVAPEIVKSFVPVESPITDLKYRWDCVPVLCSHEFRDVYERTCLYHEYFGYHFQIFREIAEAIQALKDRSRKWRKPLCFPTILEDGNHLVSFDSLVPVHLVGQSEDPKKRVKLVPINSLPKLNGQMIGLTGQNAGGKSTTMETIVNAVYLAQSGLPVFGKDVSLNVKTRVGMSFLERGSGSTLQLLLAKSKAILEVLDGKEQSGTLLVVDEVGTGTQEVDGLDFGKVFLGKLSGSGCSVIFSTQIIDLAKHAQERLGAQCFTFDLDHRISPGVGRGGIEKLMEQIGMKELLS
ncbi:MAG: hypothetical protein A2365_01940 [Candidatus Nealsonbacteria bacterium RIFOXYB1_FULL_40_15]|uniref:DNA mismatch repair proteins mutS family domain-containing protein n=2 Tax=Candidatus Nealsoniibacteriota TaxID=1817911 RepID=A0A1G2ETK9_9BACT|nr:MAG: hypothetical protein A2365_01940 [Candidatus Nealsonbacteria bacterium RIFOXYB1_FULL_40_15]OGZ29116.1 MAG: hypothetical protein A2427_02390 [Candidatus Nealsonbacteria bacterium RIFOXYC1_FULL_40_7]